MCTQNARSDGPRRGSNCNPACVSTRLAPVSRCCRELATHPELLPSSLEITLASRNRLDVRVASLRHWLERHAAKTGLRQLSLTVKQTVNLREPPALDEGPQSRRAAAELEAALLAVCGGAGGAQLEVLCLDVQLARPSCIGSSWLPALRGLTSLELAGDVCQPGAPLHQLAMLRHLALRRDSVLIPLPSQCHKLSLPAWLTSLTIVRDYGFELPTAVRHLHFLEELKLEGCTYITNSYNCLPALPALRKLSMVGCGGLPVCLPELTRLQGLHCEVDYEFFEQREAVEELEDALGSLTQLTYLRFCDAAACRDYEEEEDENDEREPWQRLPSALLGLTQLRTLGWLLPPSDAALPCGDEDADGYSGASAAWMSGLRSLALPADVARRSRGQLRGAVALEELCLTGWEASEKEAQKELLELAWQLPCIQRVAYCSAGPGSACTKAAGLVAGVAGGQ